MSVKSELEIAFSTQFIRLGSDLPDPVTHYRFHPKRKWEVDVAWVDQKLAVEVEGGSKPRPVRCHNCKQSVRARKGDGSPGKILMLPGWHQTSRYTKDIEKYNALTAQGWFLLRFAHDDIIGDPFEMVDTIRTVLGLRSHDERYVDYLSPKEKEVLYLVAAGFTGVEISKRLGKSQSSIRTRIQGCCEKLVVRSRTAAVARAINWKLLESDKIPWPEEFEGFA